MPDIFPLIQIPLNAFWAKKDHNTDMLTRLRRKAKKSDGYFLYRDPHHLADVFTLENKKFHGNWRLGRIRLPVGEENTGEYDFIVEVYRRCLNKTDPTPTTYMIRALDNASLADIIRDLDKGTNIGAYPSNWEVKDSATFTGLGFEIC